MRHTLKETASGLRRNASMNVAILVTMWVSLTLFGLGMLVTQQVDLIKGRWYDRIDVPFPARAAVELPDQMQLDPVEALAALVRATTASLITVATCGIAVGFLLHNFHPAKMFMGDSGAMLLGLLMAMSAISFTGQLDPGATDQQDGNLLPALLPILLPLAALALPIADLVLAWARRTWNGQHVFHADKQHLHHRLLAHGHSHWGAVLLMYGWTAVVSVGLVVMALSSWPYIGWLVGAILLLLLGLTLRPMRPLPAATEAHRDAADEVARG